MTQNETIIYTEEFNFILNNDDGIISSTELISYLTGLSSLMKSVNHTLNSKYSIEFDQISIDVIALEKGSFNIKTNIKKYIKKGAIFAAGAVATAIIGDVVTKLLADDKTPITYVFNNCNVVINRDTVMSNRDTVKSVSRIAKTIVNSKNTTSLKIEYETPKQGLRSTTIEKTTLTNLIVEEKEEKERESIIIHNARLVIVSPVLEIEQADWRVKLNDRKFNAKMTDEDFLKTLDGHNIAFGKGDTITADIETIITTKSDSTPDVKHYIRKVHKYPQYKTAKLEPLLFD